MESVGGKTSLINNKSVNLQVINTKTFKSFSQYPPGEQPYSHFCQINYAFFYRRTIIIILTQHVRVETSHQSGSMCANLLSRQGVSNVSHHVVASWHQADVLCRPASATSYVYSDWLKLEHQPIEFHVTTAQLNWLGIKQ